jgi:hypothetical protein
MKNQADTSVRFIERTAPPPQPIVNQGGVKTAQASHTCQRCVRSITQKHIYPGKQERWSKRKSSPT